MPLKLNLHHYVQERGTLDENRNVDEEKFYKGMMKQVRTVEMPELSDEQIQARTPNPPSSSTRTTRIYST